jgi:hypothetical protein
MGVALAAAAAAWIRHGTHATRDRLMEAMNLFAGVTLTVMGVGHLLAITTKLAQGSLAGSPPLLYGIGIAIVVPATLIVLNASRARTAILNGWMAGTLAVLGPINLPLAIPLLLNIAYAKHANRRAGSIILAAFVVVNMALFAGGVWFLLSGARTFEEFSTTR